MQLTDAGTTYQSCLSVLLIGRCYQSYQRYQLLLAGAVSRCCYIVMLLSVFPVFPILVSATYVKLPELSVLSVLPVCLWATTTDNIEDTLDDMRSCLSHFMLPSPVLSVTPVVTSPLL